MKVIETSDNDSEARMKAYFYALLMFACSICKLEADAIHLWFGRRASTRVRTQLMTSIYAKALVRKDYSGIVEEKKTEDSKPKTNDAANGSKDKKKENKDGRKNSSGADIGKIITLMSADTNRIVTTVSSAYFFYVSCPLLHRPPYIERTLYRALHFKSSLHQCFFISMLEE